MGLTDFRKPKLLHHLTGHDPEDGSRWPFIFTNGDGSLLVLTPVFDAVADERRGF
jgi:hypothetical protein